MSLLNDAKLAKEALEKVIDHRIDVQTRDCMRLYKAKVVTPANENTKVMGVQLIQDTAEMDLPYTKAVANAQEGDIVWVATIYDSWRNAVVFANSDFDIGSSGIGDGRGIVSIVKTATNGLIDTYTITYTDNTTSTFTVTNGSTGVGISSITKTSTSGLVDTYTITFTNNDTSTFTVTNGKDGTDGAEYYQYLLPSATCPETIDAEYHSGINYTKLYSSQRNIAAGDLLFVIYGTANSKGQNTQVLVLTSVTTSGSSAVEGNFKPLYFADGEQGEQGVQGERGYGIYGGSWTITVDTQPIVGDNLTYTSGGAYYNYKVGDFFIMQPQTADGTLFRKVLCKIVSKQANESSGSLLVVAILEGEQGESALVYQEVIVISSVPSTSSSNFLPIANFNREPVAGETFIAVFSSTTTNLTYLALMEAMDISGESYRCMPKSFYVTTGTAGADGKGIVGTFAFNNVAVQPNIGDTFTDQYTGIQAKVGDYIIVQIYAGSGSNPMRFMLAQITNVTTQGTSTYELGWLSSRLLPP